VAKHNRAGAIAYALRHVAHRAAERLGLRVQRLSRARNREVLGLNRYRIAHVLDIGANEGQFGSQALELFPDAKIHSIEPLPGPFERLRRWAETEGRERVSVHHLALGAAEGALPMFEHTAHSTSSSLLRTTGLTRSLWPFTAPERIVEVRVTTLDRFVAVELGELEGEVLVKMDVQGYEDRVIGGGSRTLRQARACLVEICLAPLYEQQGSFVEIVRVLEELGLRYAGNYDQTLAADGQILYVDALFVR
jgi:FkbM family methyltransferase